MEIRTMKVDGGSGRKNGNRHVIERTTRHTPSWPPLEKRAPEGNEEVNQGTPLLLLLETAIWYKKLLRSETNDINSLILHITGVVAGERQTPDSNRGLVYLYKRDLLLTGNFWNVIVNLNLNWYRTKVDMLNTIVRQTDFYRTRPRLVNNSY